MLLLSLLGCPWLQNPGSASYGEDKKNLPQGRIVRITCQHDVQISKNDTLIIEFIQYPGRAYSWEMMTDEASLQNLMLVKSNRHDLGNMPDSPEKVEFFFHGLKEGEELLVFKYFRPWEQYKPAADSCIVKVNIK